MQHLYIDGDIVAFQLRSGSSCGYDSNSGGVRNDVLALIDGKLNSKVPNAACIVCSDSNGKKYSFVFGTDGQKVSNLPCYQGISAGTCEWNK